MSELTPIEIHTDAGVLARRAAEVIAEHAHTAIEERGNFTLAVSGGKTPRAMFAELASQNLRWDQTEIFQVDERVAPAGDESRNLTHLEQSLPAGAVPRVRAMPVEDPDLDAAADRYAQALPAFFDLIHLGLGPDGHTASLVPGDPVLDILDRDVAITRTYMGHRRMTLTYPIIDRARSRLWVVAGADKVDALARLREHDRSIPAGRVASQDTLILADTTAAAGGVQSPA